MLILIVLVGWLLRRSFIKVYSIAQVALQETLTQNPASPREIPLAQPAMLREANLATVVIDAGSPAAGKLIREFELRTRTGTSIVGIERSGANIINPGPNEELQSGDHVLLLGSPGQLDAARLVLGSPAPGGR